MKSIKNYLSSPSTAIILFLLAIGMIYAGGSLLLSVRSSDEYEDKGIMTFEPYRVLPQSVRNTGNAYSRRTNPTKTVYMVYYRASGSGYEWHREVASQSVGERIVAQGEPVERRVLVIVEEGSYITVEADQTAESYTAGLRRRGYAVIGGAVALLIIPTIAKLLDKRQREQD